MIFVLDRENYLHRYGSIREAESDLEAIDVENSEFEYCDDRGQRFVAEIILPVGSFRNGTFRLTPWGLADREFLSRLLAHAKFAGKGIRDADDLTELKTALASQDHPNRGGIMFIAGEASGDTLGAELAAALPVEAGVPITMFGAGGGRMAQAGVEIVLDLAPHAVVGIWEVLKHFKKFKQFFLQLLEVAFERRPATIVLIDYPGFNLRFARAIRKRIRQEGIDWRPRIVYYVSPQIWAWHESRIHQIAEDIDLLLSIFPFEAKWYRERKPDFRVEFVGHPLVDRFGAEKTEPPAGGPPRILLLPGSRERELRKHLPPMLAAAEQLARESGARLEMVFPNEALREFAAPWMQEHPGVAVQVGGLAEALQRATLAIASSGTVTMECAWFRVPTVVIYKTSWSTYWLGRFFIAVKYVAMPNLLAERALYPELIQGDANATNMARAGAELLRPGERREEIRRGLDDVIRSLGEPGASHRAARAILSLGPM